MGKFIVYRTAAGDRFFLRSDTGHTLAISRHYATLDACKKGIASLIVNAPVIPVLDATVGEYGPNPKFEIVERDPGFAFVMKSANGTSVITSPAYATKKACLRGIAMLRHGVESYELLFHNKEGLTPLTMKAPTATVTLRPDRPAVTKRLRPAAPSKVMAELEREADASPSVQEATSPVQEPTGASSLFEDASAVPEEVVDVSVAEPVADAEPAPTPTEPQPVAAPARPTQPTLAPRLVRLQETEQRTATAKSTKAPDTSPAPASAARHAKAARAPEKQPPKRRGLLGFLFKK
ncbi:MAG: DUF1508 domain-containing protein [Clostridia bacterium]|nr:DUF1508 domain-containing protein [Clostridia bacterium]